jgi:hypothetical protein
MVDVFIDRRGYQRGAEGACCQAGSKSGKNAAPSNDTPHDNREFLVARVTHDR